MSPVSAQLWNESEFSSENREIAGHSCQLMPRLASSPRLLDAVSRDTVT